MNLDNIKEIVNDKNLTDESKRRMILKEISLDKSAFEYLFYILQLERERYQSALVDMNVNMSRLTYFASQKKRKWFGEGLSFEFVVNELNKFYNRYKGLREVGPRNNEEKNIFPKYLDK